MMARILKLLFLISLSFSIWTEHSVRLQIKKKFTVKKWMQHKVVFIMFVFSMQVFKVNYLRVTNLWTRHCMLYISDLWLRVEVKQVCLQVVDKMCNVHCTFQVVSTGYFINNLQQAWWEYRPSFVFPIFFCFLLNFYYSSLVWKKYMQWHASSASTTCAWDLPQIVRIVRVYSCL